MTVRTSLVVRLVAGSDESWVITCRLIRKVGRVRVERLR